MSRAGVQTAWLLWTADVQTQNVLEAKSKRHVEPLSAAKVECSMALEKISLAVRGSRAGRAETLGVLVARIVLA